MERPVLLAIDDHEHILKQLRWALADDFEVHTACTKSDALDALRRIKPALLTVDLSLQTGQAGHSQREGFDILQVALRADPSIKAIVITSDQEELTAMQAVRMGACDFFVKPVPLQELRVALKRVAYVSDLERRAHQAPDTSPDMTGIVGDSAAIVELKQLVRRVAETEFTILILGESGVGKELVAAAVSKLSPRRERPYVVVNCAAIPETLLESELFGYEKGAFTGAQTQKKGRLELANEGTLFLDEIGDLSQALQAKLLRFLQQRTIERVGGTRSLQLDVRVIAATNRDLESDVRAKLFREDLYYRLRVLSVRVPALRERGEDVVLLANHFLERASREIGAPRKRLARDAEVALQQHDWPGNIRELENTITEAAVTTQGPLIGAHHLGLLRANAPRDLRGARDEVERALIERALQRHGGVVSRAARDLSVSRVTLYDLMVKHGLRSAAPTRTATE